MSHFRAQQGYRRRANDHYRQPVDINGNIDQTFHVPLKNRLLPGEQLSSPELIQLEKDIQAQVPDLFVISEDDCVNLVNTSILNKMSQYFDAIVRNPMRESQSKTIKLTARQDQLRVVLDFAYHGNITLSGSNVADIFELANYLQMESLSNLCKSFLRKNALVYAQQAFELATKFFVPQVGEFSIKALVQRPEVLTDASYAKNINVDLFCEVFSSDDLNVATEDMACKLFLSWMTAIQRSDDDVEWAVECLRVPHMTLGAADNLSNVLKEMGINLDTYTLCRNRRFTELPAEQLTPRNRYIFHAHLLWEDEMDYSKGPKQFTTSCTRVGYSKVYTNTALSTMPHKCALKNYEFAVVNDSLMKIVQNRRNTQILMYTVDRQGNLNHEATFERNAELTDFAVCADGSNCVVSYFYDFGVPPKFSAWDTESGEKEDDYVQVSSHLRLSPREMEFYQDYIVLLRNQTVIICNRETNDSHEIKFGDEFTGKMVNFIRVGNNIYVYRDTETSYPRSGGPINECIHKINLATHRIETTFNVRIVPTSLAPNHGPGRVRKFIRFQKQIQLLTQDDEHGEAQLHRFGPLANGNTSEASSSLGGRGGNPVRISTYNIRAPENDRTVFSRKFLTQIPLYLNRCSHETLLQIHLRMLPEEDRAGELEKLKPFGC